MAGGGAFDPSAWPWAAGATGVLLLLGLMAIFPSAFRKWWPRVFVYTGKGRIPRDVVRVEVHPSVTEIPDRLCEGCDRLESLILHEGLLRIGNAAFADCTSLRSFLCPATVTEIGAGAFDGCSNLAEVVLSEGLQSIEDGTFWECTSLRAIRIPASVARIGNWAFSYCTNLALVEIAEGPESIGESAFCCCQSLREIRIPASVTSIVYGAFRGCTGLTYLRLGEGLKKIAGDSFENCTGLELVEMDERLESIETPAFRGCTSLKRFRFARLSECMEAVSMDRQTAVMFDERLIEIAAAMTREYDGDPEQAEALWGNCKRSLERAYEILTYLELKRGAMPVLEMALWRAQIQNEERGGGREEVTNNGEGGDDLNGAEGDAQRLDLARDIDQRTRILREERLVRCGSGVICPGVLNFLAVTSWPQLSEFGVTSTQE